MVNKNFRHLLAKPILAILALTSLVSAIFFGENEIFEWIGVSPNAGSEFPLHSIRDWDWDSQNDARAIRLHPRAFDGLPEEIRSTNNWPLIPQNVLTHLHFRFPKWIQSIPPANRPKLEVTVSAKSSTSSTHIITSVALSSADKLAYNIPITFPKHTKTVFIKLKQLKDGPSPWSSVISFKLPRNPKRLFGFNLNTLFYFSLFIFTACMICLTYQVLSAASPTILSAILNYLYSFLSWRTIFYFIFCASALTLLLTLSTFIPNTVIKTRIRAAYSRQLINPTWSPVRDAVEGLDTFSDCAILDYLTDRRETHLLSALAPRYRYEIGHHGINSPTTDLEAAVNLPPPKLSGETTTRYWFGYFIILRPLLYFFGIQQVRQILLLLTIIFASLAIYFWTQKSLQVAFNLLSVFITMLLLQNVFGYGRSLCHFPMYLTPWLLALTILPLKAFLKEKNSKILIPILSGCVASFFENATGVIIATLITLICVTFYDNTEDSAATPINRLTSTIGTVIIATASFILMTLSKLFLLASLIGYQKTFGEFFRAIATRTGEGQSISVGTLLNSLHSDIFRFTFYNEGIAAFVVLYLKASFIILVTIILIAQFIRISNELAAGALISLFSFLLTFSWYLLFSNHTILHSWFTVRFIAFPIAISFSAFCLMLKEQRPSDLCSRIRYSFLPRGKTPSAE